MANNNIRGQGGQSTKAEQRSENQRDQIQTRQLVNEALTQQHFAT